MLLFTVQSIALRVCLYQFKHLALCTYRITRSGTPRTFLLRLSTFRGWWCVYNSAALLSDRGKSIVRYVFEPFKSIHDVSVYIRWIVVLYLYFCLTFTLVISAVNNAHVLLVRRHWTLLYCVKYRCHCKACIEHNYNSK